MVKRHIAGVLLLLSGLIGLLFAFTDLLYAKDPPEFSSSTYYQTRAIMTLVFTTGAFFGAYFAISGQSRALAIGGSISALFALPVLSIGFFIAILALVLLILSKKEFEIEKERHQALMEQPRTQY